MIPLRDNIPSSTTPIVNYGIIAACTFAFFAQLSTDRQGASLVERYAMIPVRVLHPDDDITVRESVPFRTPFGIQMREVSREIPPAGVPAQMTLLTCIFLHGGWMHFLGNMLFLFIFGDNVEDRFGHVGYLAFYLAAGVAASAAHLAANPDSPVPTIGASGAIAGVMGAYFCLYPKAMVLAVIPIIFFFEMIVLPAPVFLGIWFVLQLFQGVTAGATGVAWWAHIGGFAVGLAVAAVLDRCHRLRPKVTEIRPGTDHAGAYRIYPRRL